MLGKARISVYTLLFAMGTIAVAQAQNKPKSLSSKPESVRTTEDDSRQLVVMRTGKVHKGKVLKSGGQILVKDRGTIRTFSPDKVWVIASDKTDAYYQLSRKIPADSSTARMQLAYWCLKQNLQKELIKELKLVLILDPNNQRAKTLLAEKLSKDDDTTVNAFNIRTTGQPIALMGKRVETLGGLPNELAGEFTKGIQPILKNKCGTTHCHGKKTKTDFSLKNTLGNKSQRRSSSEANLNSVLEWVDKRQPQHSQLLKYATTPHGNLSRSIFSKSRAHQFQLQRLTRWTMAVAPHLEEKKSASATDSQFAEKPMKAEPKLLPITGTEKKLIAGQNRIPAKKSRVKLLNGVKPQEKVKTAAKKLESENLDKQLIEELLNDVQPDAFDPAEFNNQTAK